MRILFLNPIGALGGGERSLLDIFAAIRVLRPDWELHLIAGSDGPLLEEARFLGVTAEVLPMPEAVLVMGDSTGSGKKNNRLFAAFGICKRLLFSGFAARRYARVLRAKVLELKPNLIHSNGIKFHLLTRLMGRVNIPVIWHIRDFIGSRKLMCRVLRWAAPAANLAVANSEATAEDARRVLRGVTVRTVLNCIDTERFSPGIVPGETLDALAGLAPAEQGTLRIGLLASFARWKGQDLLLKAAALVKDRLTQQCVRFYIIGGPIYKTQGSQFSVAELQQLAAGLGLDHCVGFIPFQNKPEPVYRALDIVVHASTQPEPFGRTIVEAMSCGKPVVAALAGGVKELFQSGTEAVGVQPNDPDALADSLCELIQNSVLRETMSQRARSAAETRFSRSRLGSEMALIYDAFSSDNI